MDGMRQRETDLIEGRDNVVAARLGMVRWEAMIGYGVTRCWNALSVAVAVSICTVEQ